MNRPCRKLAAVLPRLLGAVLAIGVSQSHGQAVSRPASGAVNMPHFQVDLAARKLTVAAEVCLGSRSLEVWLCKQGTKDYESILRTQAEPSQLHAALLLLGLSPGKPAEWLAPDDSKPLVLPPRGAALSIQARWRDKDGVVRIADAGRFIKPAAGKGLAPPKQWIFVGSEVLPDGTYWADREGAIISVANFASAVIDVPFESSADDALHTFVADAEAIPPVGTKVEVIIAPAAGAENAPDARAFLNIDRYGDLRLDGLGVSFDELAELAGQLVARHAKAQVVIVPDPFSLAADVVRAQEELRFGGVNFFSQRWVAAREPILPRTADQIEQAMRQWARKFANPRDYVEDPAQEAQLRLQQIDKELAELAVRQKLLNRYAAELRKCLERYQTAGAASQGGIGAGLQPGR